jgi:hypothetical protein
MLVGCVPIPPAAPRVRQAQLNQELAPSAKAEQETRLALQVAANQAAQTKKEQDASVAQEERDPSPAVQQFEKDLLPYVLSTKIAVEAVYCGLRSQEWGSAIIQNGNIAIIREQDKIQLNQMEHAAVSDFVNRNGPTPGIPSSDRCQSISKSSALSVLDNEVLDSGAALY